MPDAFDKLAKLARTVPASLMVVTAHELLAMKLSPRETILAPWLPQKGIAMIYGPRGIGKTHITLGAAYAIATGGTFLRWKADKPRRVLILDGEMPTVTLQERLATIVGANSDEPPAPDFLRLLPIDLQERGLDLGAEPDQLDLARYLDGTDAIFVDNISTLARAGRENEAESWLPVQEWALEQRRAGRSVVFIHHAGKGGLQRGTSRREDVLDTVIALRKPADHAADQGARFEVHFEKNRGFHGDDAKPFEAALGAGGWTMRDLADADIARVVVLTGEGMSARDIAKETGFSKSRVQRLQEKAREAGLMEADGYA
jgi:putative DNA primase/helicase